MEPVRIKSQFRQLASEYQTIHVNPKRYSQIKTWIDGLDLTALGDAERRTCTEMFGDWIVEVRVDSGSPYEVAIKSADFDNGTAATFIRNLPDDPTY